MCSHNRVKLQADMTFPLLLQTKAVFVSHLYTVVVIPLQRKSCWESPGQMASGLSLSPGCHGWSLSQEGGRVDRQSWSQSRDHQQLWDRAASAAAPASVWE